MFSHVTIGARDLARMTAFYDAILTPIGLARRDEPGDNGCACWMLPGHSLPQFFVQQPFDGNPATTGNGAMTAFLAPDEAAVDLAHAAGIAAGGTDEGAPGLRPHYGKGYYGAYLRDPEGNKTHIVHRGDIT